MDDSEEVVASGSSGSSNNVRTHLANTLSFAFSTGQKEIVLDDGERALVPETDFVTPSTNISLNNSTGHFGNNTSINGNVVIHQIINTVSRETRDVEDDVECNQNDTLINMKNKNTSMTKDYERHPSRRKVSLLIGGFAIIIILILAIQIPIMYLSRDRFVVLPSTEPTGITPSPGSDADVFIPRDKWGGVRPSDPIPTIPAATLVVVKHTGGKNCRDEKTCRARVREIQREHMEILEFPDISYNFLIGGDEKIYVGRGYHVKNEGRNDSLDIAFIGNFNIDLPTTAMISNAQRVILKATTPFEEAVDFDTYEVINHNQTEKTDSPGKNLFAEVTKWDYYTNETYFDDS